MLQHVNDYKLHGKYKIMPYQAIQSSHVSFVLAIDFSTPRCILIDLTFRYCLSLFYRALHKYQK